MGLAKPYLWNGQPHDYVLDFIVRLMTQDGNPPLHLILETKGYDVLQDVKTQAAQRWVSAINADGRYGRWAYAVVNRIADVRKRIDSAVGAKESTPT